jgi:hypothetical protein
MQVVNRPNVEHYTWSNGCDGWHLIKRDDLSIITERVPAGESLHYYFLQLFISSPTDLAGYRMMADAHHD